MRKYYIYTITWRISIYSNLNDLRLTQSWFPQCNEDGNVKPLHYYDLVYYHGYYKPDKKCYWSWTSDPKIWQRRTISSTYQILDSTTIHTGKEISSLHWYFERENNLWVRQSSQHYKRNRNTININGGREMRWLDSGRCRFNKRST